MKTSGIFCLHDYIIPVRLSQPFRLIFFGDVKQEIRADIRGIA